LEKAGKMLSDAKLLQDQGRMESAADRAYYSMLHAAQAALAALGKKAPRSHRGLRSQFGQHLVSTGLVEREYARDLTKAHEVRQESTYEAHTSTGEDEMADLITRAERFVTRMTRLATERTA
jgi:uncharacterized protein (UPF0332 family)